MATDPLATPKGTLSIAHLQDQIGVAVGRRTTGLPARSRGWGLNASIRATKANHSPWGLLLDTWSSSASCTLHAGGAACQAHRRAWSAGAGSSGQQAQRMSPESRPRDPRDQLLRWPSTARDPVQAPGCGS